MQLLELYSPSDLAIIAGCTFAFSTAKGGFPAGIAAMPLLILLWPDPENAAREAISYMLPLLVLMDICGFAFYRKRVNWKELRPITVPTLVGVAIAGGILHLAIDSSASDRWLKLFTGVVGLSFVVYQAFRTRILKKIGKPETPHPVWVWFCGTLAGLSSTLCHIGGTAAQAYYLSRPLEKMPLAATVVGFFLVLNAVKLIPYTLLDIFTKDILTLSAWMIPAVPLGVLAGYLATRALKPSSYVSLLYITMSVASIGLIIKAL